MLSLYGFSLVYLISAKNACNIFHVAAYYTMHLFLKVKLVHGIKNMANHSKKKISLNCFSSFACAMNIYESIKMLVQHFSQEFSYVFWCIITKYMGKMKKIRKIPFLFIS